MASSTMASIAAMSASLGSRLMESRQPHHLDAQHRVGDQRHDVGAQRQRVQVVEVAAGVGPVRLVGDRLQHGLGDVLHACEAIDDRVLLGRALVAERQAQRAVAHHRGRGPVADDLGQARVHLDLQVDVGVDVQQARHDPPARGVDDLRGLAGGQSGAPGDHAAGRDGDVLGDRWATVAIEEQPAGDQQVPGCVSHRTVSRFAQEQLAYRTVSRRDAAGRDERRG
jgi:hypothetical protein